MPRSRGLLAVIVALVAVVAAVLVIGGRWLSDRWSTPDVPGNAVVLYLSDIEQGHYDEAHARLCEDIRDQVTVEDLASGAADDLVPINEVRFVESVGERTMEDVESPTQRFLGNGPNGIERWEVGLVDEGGWRLCTFRLD
jgi:hypothetical protein